MDSCLFDPFCVCLRGGRCWLGALSKAYKYILVNFALLKMFSMNRSFFCSLLWEQLGMVRTIARMTRDYFDGLKMIPKYSNRWLPKQ